MIACTHCYIYKKSLSTEYSHSMCIGLKAEDIQVKSSFINSINNIICVHKLRPSWACAAPHSCWVYGCKTEAPRPSPCWAPPDSCGTAPEIRPPAAPDGNRTVTVCRWEHSVSPLCMWACVPAQRAAFPAVSGLPAVSLLCGGCWFPVVCEAVVLSSRSSPRRSCKRPLPALKTAAARGGLPSRKRLDCASSPALSHSSWKQFRQT